MVMPADDAAAGAERAVAASFAAVAELEPRLHAFVATADPHGARADAAAGAGGRLGGWAVGVKDVLDTADLPTELGSPIYRGRRPGRDAACVARLREAGAVVVGKTVTCELAAFHPGPTRNPHDPERTPGGSSSGSAAAVAAGMVRAALGTQTAGSVIRPAAFCGVVGYKPSFGHVNRSGLMPFAESLDTIGVFAATVADAARLAGVVAAREDLDPRAWPRGPWPRVRVGLCRTPEWGEAESATREAVETAAARVDDAGGEVRELRVGPAFDRALAAQTTIQAAEGAAALSDERRRHAEELSEELRALLAVGAATTADGLDAAHRVAADAAAEVAAAFDDVDVILTPATPGEAPAGLDTTGDPLFNRRWTLVGVPTLALPAGVGPAGLPVGVQLVGPRGGDAALLAAGHHLAALLPDTPPPPVRVR